MNIHQPPQIRVNGKYIDNPQYKKPSRIQIMIEKLLAVLVGSFLGLIGIGIGSILCVGMIALFKLL